MVILCFSHLLCVRGVLMCYPEVSVLYYGNWTGFKCSAFLVFTSTQNAFTLRVVYERRGAYQTKFLTATLKWQ